MDLNTKYEGDLNNENLGELQLVNIQSKDKQHYQDELSLEHKSQNSDIEEEKSFFLISDLKDFRNLFGSCFENALAFFFDWIPNIITLYFINNHTTQIEASGFGLGLVWSNSIGQGLYYGLSSGFETLAAHAHGAGNYDLVGILYQRTLYITFIMFVPILFAMLQTKDILLLWNSDEELCEQAANYCIYALPGLFFAAIAFQFKASLNAQNIYNLQYQAVAWSVPFHFIMAYAFISISGLKIIGGALAFSCSQFTSLAILYYLVKSKQEYQKCYIPFNKKCMQDIIPFLKIVIPIGSLLTLEWLVYETYSIIASNLVPAQYSAHIVLANFNTIYYQFPEGYSIATSTFVGNEMGNAKPNRAKRFAKYGLIVSLAHFAISLFPIYLLKYQILGMFSVDQEVEDQLLSTFNLFILAVISDCSQVMITGLMRAIGKERYSSISFIVSYVGIGIFCAYVFAYPFGFELHGIWAGAITGSMVYNILQLIQLKNSDWHALSEMIQERIQSNTDIELKDFNKSLLA